MLRLQALKPEDALWLEALHGTCFDARRRWSAKLIGSFLQGPAAFGRAAVIENEPAGFILAQMAGEEAEIVTLATLPSFRRKGVGKRLVEDFISTAKEQGKTQLFLEVAENNSAAVALYRSLGFEKTGVRSNYYEEDKGGIDAWIMRKSLSPSP